MKIVIDGVEYIATPVGNKCMHEGVCAISRRYNDCPKFFDKILNGGFAYYERDEFGFDLWATNDGKVFLAHDMDFLFNLEEKDRRFFETHYPDISEWNLPEFTEHLVKSNCIFQISAADASVMLLKHGPAYTYAQLNRTGNLPAIMEIEHPVTIK